MTYTFLAVLWLSMTIKQAPMSVWKLDGDFYLLKVLTIFCKVSQNTIFDIRRRPNLLAPSSCWKCLLPLSTRRILNIVKIITKFLWHLLYLSRLLATPWAPTWRRSTAATSRNLSRISKLKVIFPIIVILQCFYSLKPPQAMVVQIEKIFRKSTDIMRSID